MRFFGADQTRVDRIGQQNRSQTQSGSIEGGPSLLCIQSVLFQGSLSGTTLMQRNTTAWPAPQFALQKKDEFRYNLEPVTVSATVQTVQRSPVLRFVDTPHIHVLGQQYGDAPARLDETNLIYLPPSAERKILYISLVHSSSSSMNLIEESWKCLYVCFGPPHSSPLQEHQGFTPAHTTWSLPTHFFSG